MRRQNGGGALEIGLENDFLTHGQILFHDLAQRRVPVPNADTPSVPVPNAVPVHPIITKSGSIRSKIKEKGRTPSHSVTPGKVYGKFG